MQRKRARRPQASRRENPLQFEALEQRRLLAVDFRVNAGGPLIAGTPNWQADNGSLVNIGNPFTTSNTIDVSHPSLPAGTPAALFQTERWDSADTPEMQWDFPVTPGSYEVRLYFAETWIGFVGGRQFDVSIEGNQVLDNYDIFAQVGPNKGIMESFVVTSDANLDIDFFHVVENPAIKAIEIISLEGGPTNTPPTATKLNQTKTYVQGAASVALDDIVVSDADAGETITAQLVLSNPAVGSLSTGTFGGTTSTYSAGLWQAIGPVSEVNAALAAVAFLPVSSNTLDATLTTHIEDAAGTGPADGSILLDVTVTPPPTSTAFRVNAGGPLIAGTPDWQADNGSLVNIGNPFTTSNTIDVSHPSLPAGTPAALFQTERWDSADTPEMQWDFPVTPGSYEVRLYFAETWIGFVGGRQFDVSIEGNQVLDNYDIFAQVGPNKGIMESFVVTSDANLDIDFFHVVENPAIKAIEIISLEGGPTNTPPTATKLNQTKTYVQGAASVALDDIVVSDADAGETITAQLVLSNPAVGSLSTGTFGGTTSTYSAGLWQAIGPVSEVNAALAAVAFLPVSSNTLDATLTTHIEDAAGTGPADGSILLDVTVTPPPTSTAFRVNAGGPLIAGTPDWQADNGSLVNIGNPFTTSNTIDVSHPSLPAGTPAALFQTERWDSADTPEMQWDFPVTPGSYEVRLYFAETWIGFVGGRQFDVSIEGNQVLDNYDIFAQVGPNKGIMESFVVTSDANLDIDFFHVVENPAIKAIEIISLGGQSPTTLSVNANGVSFGNVAPGNTDQRVVTFTNPGQAGDPDITISGVSVTGGNGAFVAVLDAGAPVVLSPGESTTATITYQPPGTDIYSATLQVSHDASNTISLPLSGGIPFGFGKSTLAGTSLTNGTSLQFGPDGRLYVSTQQGLIHVYDVQRDAANSYSVSGSETIDLVQDIVNHNDNGTPNFSITERLITGILVAGTATNPIIYVGSSDPRIGAGPSGADLNLDTNSGVLSKLTFSNGSWSKVDLVRGLPRSEENHGPNGMQFDPTNGHLLLTVGGNTNMGGPSNNFALLPEFALSAAVLTIDIATIEAMPTLTDVHGQAYKHDLATLDDEDRDFDGLGGDANLATQIQDVFGGNNGKNQAILVPGDPVQIYSPGWRNPYDLVVTTFGDIWTVDNGANAGWGDVPILDPVTGLATNQISEPGITTFDNLQKIAGPGYYGGHPNPTRANTDNTFNASNPQSPVALVGGNPVESFFQVPQGQDALAIFTISTNGIVEYTASNFGGQMQGDLLAVSFYGGNAIHRLSPNATRDGLDLDEVLAGNLGVAPLDITVMGDMAAFPGTIWVTDYHTGSIIVLEPNDFEVGGGSGCLNDNDCDGYLNDDELANGTNPNSSADTPPDVDGDFVSDLLDADDDNDSQLDHVDPFAIDPDNGTTTPVNTLYAWENDGGAGGLLNLGFTGLMTNGQDNYQALYDLSALTAGGAAGVLTLDAATSGTALGSANTQQQAFQFAVNASTTLSPFVARTSVAAPWAGLTPQAGQQMGFYIGTGDQDNFLQLVLAGDDGGSVQLTSEIAGVTTVEASTPFSMANVDFVELYLEIDPLALSVQAKFAASIGGVLQPVVLLGTPVSIPASWLSSALAIGVISTNGNNATSFPATWDYLGFESVPVSTTGATFIEVNSGGNVDTSSTYASGSFRITNYSVGGEKIETFRIDLRQAGMKDLVFDPFGLAGDPVAKEFTPDSGASATGLTGFSYLSPHDGGYDVLEIYFSDFGPGEQFTFSIDLDPTSVQGAPAPGPADSASVSGFELSGALVQVVYTAGAVQANQLFGDGLNPVRAEATLEPGVPSAPTMQVLGLGSSAAVTSQANQTVRITGPVGSTVNLLVAEGGLYLDGVPNGGFDIDPYEANKYLGATLYQGTIGASGYVDIGIVLTKSDPSAGLNHLAAALVYGDENKGPQAQQIIEYSPVASLSAPALSSFESQAFTLEATSEVTYEPVGSYHDSKVDQTPSFVGMAVATLLSDKMGPSGNRSHPYFGDPMERFVAVDSAFADQLSVGRYHLGEELTAKLSLATSARASNRRADGVDPHGDRQPSKHSIEELLSRAFEAL